jgi:DNA-binding NarL/FixJ family response regulator
VPLNILIVDDNPIIRRMLRVFIEHDTQWNVCGEAENGQVALEYVKRSPPDVVILDLQMRVMNGLEAARQISYIAPKTTMAMLTLYAREEVSEQARAVGVQRVFSKADNLSILTSWLKTLGARATATAP